MWLFSFIATVLSITGYALFSRLGATKKQQKLGLILRLTSGAFFSAYGVYLRDFSFIILTVFYFVVDSTNLFQRIKNE